MAQTQNRKRHRKRRNIKTPVRNTVNHIISLVTRVLYPGNEPSHEAMDGLARLIERLIEHGSQDIVKKAVDVLVERGADEAAEEVTFLADHAARVTPVSLPRESSINAEPQATKGRATLFLIPVTLVGDGQRNAPKSLTNAPDTGSALDRATRSFHAAGLISNESSVLLAPYLYFEPDLPDDWQGWKRLHRTLLKQSVYGHDPGSLPVPKARDAADNRPVQQCYMLVSVQSALDEPEPGPLIMPEDDGADLASLIAVWSHEFAQILKDDLGPRWEVKVVAPVSPTRKAMRAAA